MGGRGASSGFSADGKPYGSEYRTLLESDNIKFVQRNEGSPSAPLETRTDGRIYVTVDSTGDKLKAISFYDETKKRYRQIDLDHYHKINGKAEKPHVQMGYLHNGEALKPTEIDRALIDKVEKLWYNRNSKHGLGG